MFRGTGINNVQNFNQNLKDINNINKNSFERPQNNNSKYLSEFDKY